ncbi:lysyl-trna synthetase [Stylonychia lemnae]|uniref:Lysine--tRNA ligase n=1 Tax=Stylonychia lemnae TaxID=5949 RepID=A0A078BBS7_STYLE|nr:lysyl-trna synthetase [Stylonychia lemnae]|eukprot:CDW91661.1 lysyl-trna synthetase [Stylonychia lemnae]
MVSPYFALSHSIIEIQNQYSQIDLTNEHFKTVNIQTGGRIIGRRKASGNLLFLDLQSNGNNIQIMLDSSKMLLNQEESFKDIAEACQRGAIVGIQGYPGRTNAGEFTIIAQKFNLLTPCNVNMPMMNWSHKKTLKDSEQRFQKRYLDLIANNELKQFFVTRARIVKFLRRYLEDLEFLEVETPILNAQAGGALAKPFETESQILRQKLELRIAPELFLKKLIIGGFERVYELGKVFRNEGIDATHNPEFTSLEFYMAYADYRDLITLTEDLLSKLSKELYGTDHVLIPQFDMDQKLITKGDKAGEQVKETKVLEINFKGPYKQFDVCSELGLDPALLGKSAQELRKFLLPKVYGIGERNLNPDSLNEKQLIDKLIEYHIESKCLQPSFITNHPMIMSPLAKTHAQGKYGNQIYGDSAQYLSERFELFINKKEIINSYSEQNDSEMQRKGFSLQTTMGDEGHQDEELHRSDEDFLEALSYGMPPTAGWGCGIDRLCMLMCGISHIREIILFPMFRTSVLSQGKEVKKDKDQNLKKST